MEVSSCLPFQAFDMRVVLSCCCVLLVVGSAFAQSEEAEPARVEFRDAGKERVALGNVLVEAQDGGILLESRNQTIWALQPEDILSRKALETTPNPLDKDELAEQLREELPGVRIHHTKHYVICYNTTRAYAEWSGALFERLHRAFINYWSRRGLDLTETPPLVALVFRDRKSYRAYGRRELGEGIESIIGYYSYKTNRIAMYDLTEGRRGRSAAQINAMMRRERTVATVIHEATHQLAFNSGLHQRFADIPLWLSEGLAIYFESPDLKSSRGWNTIGDVNRVRLGQFRKFARERTANSLLSLVASNDRFQTAGMASEAYAESWAFCYFLIRTEPKKFASYLKLLQEKEPLREDTVEERLEDFSRVFGKLPQEMNRDFLRHMSKIR